MKAPGFGDNRRFTLQDMAIATGGLVSNPPSFLLFITRDDRLSKTAGSVSVNLAAVREPVLSSGKLSCILLLLSFRGYVFLFYTC